MMSTKVSTRFFKGLFNYLWPDTLLSKCSTSHFTCIGIESLPKEALERWSDILLFTENEYRADDGTLSELYALMIRKITYLGVACWTSNKARSSSLRFAEEKNERDFWKIILSSAAEDYWRLT